METLQGQGPGRGPGSRPLRTGVRGKALRGVASLTQEGCFPSVWRDSRRHEVSKGKLGIGASEKQPSPEEAPGCHWIPGDSSWGLLGFPFELPHLGSCFRREGVSPCGPALEAVEPEEDGTWLEEEGRRAAFSCHFPEGSPPGPSYSALCHIIY